ncbi:hypothetical protein SBF1_840008 [Candidatus Desulfosporosinus infrequens]|uniref:Uncharacterized protein n=1 Tax=Candidatus Desulfosporosinus infrequens TaxID=2043169 RepID=A0A2U3LUL6_9FIRM|nr:hypothetical protein SBF1_840008 [Candidatus Desulfosporosinus infrequens]
MPNQCSFFERYVFNFVPFWNTLKVFSSYSCLIEIGMIFLLRMGQSIIYAREEREELYEQPLEAFHQWRKRGIGSNSFDLSFMAEKLGLSNKPRVSC